MSVVDEPSLRCGLVVVFFKPFLSSWDSEDIFFGGKNGSYRFKGGCRS